MKEFSDLLAEDVAAYSGRLEGYISDTPAFYRLMTNMLDDPALPAALRPMVLAAVGYFAIAGDIIPEELQGPSGYIDDIYVCALVAEHVRRELKGDEIVERNWEGQAPIIKLMQDILSKDQDLLAGKRDLILEYIGYDRLKKIS
jgi:uncharacterized membrane protein YkvA (DUF1232 family)